MDFYFFNQCLYKYLRYNSVIFLEKKIETRWQEC